MDGFGTIDRDEYRRRWDDRYAARGMAFGVDPNVCVAEVLAGLPPGRALDLGSGQGRNAVWLARQGHEVVAVDLSEVGTAQAAAWAQNAGLAIRFVAADLLTWEPEAEAFDIVLLSYLQLPPAARAVIHAKAIRALAPGGTLLLIAHHLDNLEGGVGGPSSPDVLYTEEEMADDFSRLAIARNEQVVRHVEGDDQVGDAIDILVLAHKPAAG
ncbi:MAG: class I SAM-dependent methyltransferase [Acidimicrobiia bacterium]|jgi:SAM-dependent methyltransferase